jgi:hypothetical protein
MNLHPVKPAADLHDAASYVTADYIDHVGVNVAQHRVEEG